LVLRNIPEYQLLPLSGAEPPVVLEYENTFL